MAYIYALPLKFWGHNWDRFADYYFCKKQYEVVKERYCGKETVELNLKLLVSTHK